MKRRGIWQFVRISRQWRFFRRIKHSAKSAGYKRENAFLYDNHFQQNNTAVKVHGGRKCWVCRKVNFCFMGESHLWQ